MTKDGAMIMDCEFFPCYDWFKTFMKAEKPLIEQHENFVRTTYRNRAYVVGPNGLICLSVPLEGGRNQRARMNDIKVSVEEDWQALHWKTLEACYRRSVYFEYFEDQIHSFYQKKFQYLMDVNIESLQLVLSLLQIKKEIKLTDSYEKEVPNDFRNAFLPKNRAEFVQEPYTQPFSDRNGFEPNLSMLDFLFCCGRWA